MLRRSYVNIAESRVPHCNSLCRWHAQPTQDLRSHEDTALLMPADIHTLDSFDKLRAPWLPAQRHLTSFPLPSWANYQPLLSRLLGTSKLCCTRVMLYQQHHNCSTGAYGCAGVEEYDGDALVRRRWQPTVQV